MARPRKWATDAERKAAYKSRQSGDETHIHGDETPIEATKPRALVTEPGTKPPAEGTKPADVPLSVFDGAGRGVVRSYKGREYVLVAMGRDEPPRVVAAEAWRAHLSHTCQTVSSHTGEPFTLRGWQCREHAP